MKAVDRLVAIANDFLENRISAGDFGLSFENYLFDHEDQIHDVDREAFNRLDEIREAISMYEPSEAVRADEDGLISEEELRRKVKENINQ